MAEALTATTPSRQNPAARVLKDLTVVIPAYNEEEGLENSLRELRSACPQAEIIVVDDGSSDRTGAVAAAVAGVRVLSHTRNRGYGAALKTGIRMATRRYIAWYDADGQHRPADLAAVAMPVLRGEKDVVIGVRGKESARVRDRAVGKAILKWVVRLVSREDIPDLNSGLRCFRRDVLVRYLHLFPDGFSASTTSTLMMLKRGYRVGYVPIVTGHRVGTSTVRIFSDGFMTLQLIMRIIVLFEAFKVFSLMGACLFVPGLIYGLAVALIRGEGFPTLAGTAVMAGLFTFFIGIVADQVVELRKERFEDTPEQPVQEVEEPTDRT
jgi:glycosyltransferase involved in cell wall biosynthesis